MKREQDFQAVFDLGTSVANRRFVLYSLDKSNPHFRVGLSVGKKIGNAVTRNAVKRKLRHCLMELGDKLATKDLIIIARKGVEELDYQELKSNLIHVLSLGNSYQEGSESETET